jgi:5-carboxymethyl-2-hydroxymuconate isomerase
VRSPDSLVAHGQALLRPPESVQLDYEGEIALIIGKRGRRVARKDARDYIAGVSCFNEGTIRDWTRHGKFNVTQGKNFDRSGAFGPWMVTADEIDPLGPLELSTRVNGELRQRDNTANLRFPFDFLIEYISAFTTLHPGDVISTGTPKGAGIHQEPPTFLVPGDIVEVEVGGVGVLRNPVSDEIPPR